MRKAINFIILITYMHFYMACTTTTVKKDILIVTKTNDQNIIVVLKDSTKYNFESDMYRFKVDSLEGFAQNEDERYSNLVKIAVNDIVRIDEVVKKVQWGKVAQHSIAAMLIAGIIIAGIFNNGSFGGFN